MIKAYIDGLAVEVPDGSTILDAARQVQINIPTLCKHENLCSTGACGICVVKLKGSPKMVRACCMPLQENMEVISNDPEINEVRRSVLHLILSAHPNDCLRCGRSGNCELQKLAEDFGVRNTYFPLIPKNTPRDASTKTIVLDPDKCIKCGRCLEVCQQTQNVWALSFLERGVNTRISAAGDIQLADSPCVRCGQCSAHCPTGAIFEYDNTAEVWDALRDPELHCIAQIAPAVRVSIGEAFGYESGEILTDKTYAVLRRLGFDSVLDTNFAADVTIMEEASEFVERFAHGKGDLPLITTCCPAWVDFMEKFDGDMISHFSSCKSPQAIMGVLSKTYYAEKMGLDPAKIRMISIMPCTAKKAEISRSEEMYASGHQDVDIVLTTREISRMIKQAGIDFVNLPGEKADQLLGEYTGAGTIFGTTGGVMEAALRTAYNMVTGDELEKVDLHETRGLDGVKEAEIVINDQKIRIAVAHGLGNVQAVIDKIRNAKENGLEPPYHFVEVMACKGGCVGGGGQPYSATDRTRVKRSEGLYNDDKKQSLRCSHKNPLIKKLYDDFLEAPLSEKAESLLHNHYTARNEYTK